MLEQKTERLLPRTTNTFAHRGQHPECATEEYKQHAKTQLTQSQVIANSWHGLTGTGSAQSAPFEHAILPTPFYQRFEQITHAGASTRANQQLIVAPYHLREDLNSRFSRLGLYAVFQVEGIRFPSSHSISMSMRRRTWSRKGFNDWRAKHQR